MTTLRAIIDELSRRSLLVSARSDAADVSGITDDSRGVRAGDLYCAWRGTTRDSHDFAAGAVKAGANAVVVERELDGIDVPQIVVTDGRRAAAVAANVVFGRPADALVVTGVTGTNGKTTTAWIMRHLLSARYSAALIGTLTIGYGNDDYEGSDRKDNRYTVAAAMLYKLTRDVHFKAEVRREWLVSTVDGQDYTSNIFTVGLRYQR